MSGLQQISDTKIDEISDTKIDEISLSSPWLSEKEKQN
jgi:hypothetical protein